ncbi:MAG TPA: flagellar hook protein FlgE [Ignavibacteriaceae bacterium]|nr:flagellar hook protein FlgE [Ignavibacteriaceae bacterium]
MALLNSLFDGVSGMRNLQSMMDVIGNNIANVDTIGFKGSRVTFSNTFNQFIQAGTNPTATTGGTNSFQIGLGSKINSIDTNWTQGTFEQTGNTTDLALQGPGLFILKSNGQNFYTRAGSFIFDADGNLVNPQNGAIVQGKVAVDGSIPSGNTIQDVKIDKNLKIPAIKTSVTTWGGNLQSSSTDTQTQNIVESGTITPASTYPTDTTKDCTMYDKNGNALTLTIKYTETAANTYNIDYKISNGSTVLRDFNPGSPLASGVTINGTSGPGTYTIPALTTSSGGVNIDTGDISIDATAVRTGTDNTLSYIVDDNRTPTVINGSVSIYDSLGNAHTLSVQFTKTDLNTWRWNASIPATDGTLSNNSGTISFDSNGQILAMSPNPAILSYAPSGGAENQTIQLDFGSGTSGITQNSLSSQVAALTQNGSASASLSNINIDQYGNIEGVFSNGQSQALAQIMVATFANNNGLVSVGDNMYTVAANSGDPIVGEPGETTATTMQSGALEQSNVDLAKEFTNMIVAQRGFEANAHVITTSDTLLQDITNLIR